MNYTATSPLPPVRNDIEAFEIAPGLVLLYDPEGYAPHEVRVPASAIEYLSLMDGRRTAEYLMQKAARAGRSFSTDEFLRMIQTLDDQCYLDSPRFREEREASDFEFNRLAARPAMHAGVSYPDDPDRLREMLDGFLAAGPAQENGSEPVAVIAPHIDFRVGGASYGPAYNALRRSGADTFVIFGVAHRMSYDTFMISSKDFETPLGTVPADRELIEHFRARLPFELTRNEIAHRQEHSIEFQTVFLRHIFPDRDIRIVPILTGSLYEYVELGRGDAGADARLETLYTTLADSARGLGRSVAYIAGADLCHIGRKFGDEFDARSVLEDVRRFDLELLDHASRPDADAFIAELQRVRNRYRVCGVAPIYATMRTARPTVGKVLCYDQWDEHERDSAVTFASVAYYGSRPA
ncbi:MAG TPA: AmmeMemoRadiSam system protein B [Candidatus Kapabacteria bacterium]|nr:AmmeMemoRadiSam system protein B [Candidatus Kapabacteria bacterium]